MPSFISLEKSEYSAKPIELYSFNSGTTFWPYTSGDEEQEKGGRIYAPLADLTRTTPEMSREKEANKLKVTMPFDTDVAMRFADAVPPLSTWLTIYRRMRDLPSDDYVYWQGRVRGVEWKEDVAELDCEPIDAVLKRMGLWRQYQNICNHQLYNSRCAVSLADHKATAIVISHSGSSFDATVAAAQSAGYYKAGFAERATTGELRMITDHSGSLITMLTGFKGLQNGETIYIYAGCDHSFNGANGCAKFANWANFGGFPHVPKKNPFSSAGLN